MPGDPVRIRPMRPEDVQGCLIILAREWGTLYAENARPSLVRTFAATGWPPIHYVALDLHAPKRVVGVAGYASSELETGFFDVSWLCVARTRRGLGFGSALLRRCIEDVRGLGGALMTVTPAPGFYTRHDFEILRWTGVGGERQAIVYLPAPDDPPRGDAALARQKNSGDCDA